MFLRILVTAFLLISINQAQSSTLSLVLDQDSIQGNALGTTLTLRFASGTDNQTTFGAADFFDSTFLNLDQFGPVNLTNNVGLYPESNFANTTTNITGTINASGVTPLFNFGFSYSETDPALGFVPISLSRITASRLRGPALWTAIDGFFPNFFIDSFNFDALGTPESLSTATSLSPVPVPAAMPLFGTGLAIFGFIGWQRRRKLAGNK